MSLHTSTIPAWVYDSLREMETAENDSENHAKELVKDSPARNFTNGAANGMRRARQILLKYMPPVPVGEGAPKTFIDRYEDIAESRRHGRRVGASGHVDTARNDGTIVTVEAYGDGVFLYSLQGSHGSDEISRERAAELLETLG